MAIKGDYFDGFEVMSAWEREHYLNRRLSRTIKHAYKYASAAADVLDKVRVNPTEIKTIKDLEKLPITRKADLIESQKKDPPYGGFLAVSPRDVERIFISPGPVYEPLHSSRIKWFARAFYAAGFRKGDVVINTFTYHMSPAGILFHEAIRDCGATAIAMGTGHSEVQVKTMLDLSVTGFVGTPSFLLAVIKKAEELGHDLGEDFALKRAWFTGEMLTPSLRELFEQQYGLHTFQAYAVTEPGGCLAYECSEHSGMHFMDDYIIEIVDPQTGKQLGPGEIGEVVVTPIHNKTWGLIRFGTGDISSYTDEPCPCGRTAAKLTAILGRSDDAVKVRGMFVVGRQASQVFAGFDRISKFQIVIDRPVQRDEMTFRVELKDETVDRDKLAASLNEKFQSVCLLRADSIEFVPTGTIGEKDKPLVDRRTWR
jgi:phenylacetate-CoA ligase